MAESNSSGGGSMGGAFAAGAAGTAAGSLIGGAFNLGGLALQQKYYKEQAALQNQYNIDMWKMQADYNSPANQMRRFQEAGLNPNLIYGQGSNGNMSSPPVLQAPEVADAQKALSKIGEAFNIQNLLLNGARIAQEREKAVQEHLSTLNMQDERSALHRLGFGFDYDLKTGRFVPASDFTINTTGKPSYLLPTDLARLNKYLASIDPRMQLLSSQRAYLAPQIWMANYEKEHYPISYWIGQGGKVAKGIGDVTAIFNPARYLMPINKGVRGFVTPTGRVLNY